MGWETELFDFRPFGFDPKAGSVVLDACRLRGGAGDREIECPASASSLDIFREVADPADWQEIELGLRVAALPPGESRHLLQILCEETRLELVEDLPRDGDVLRIRLPVADLRGVVAIRPLLVRAGGRDPGLVVGVGDGVTLRVDPPADTFGGGLQVVWKEEYFEQERIENALSAVAFPAGEGTPTLYLNAGVISFRELLDTAGTRGQVARVRQLVLDQIEIDTWLSLGHHAARSLYRPDEGGGAPELIDEELVEGWMGGVLRGLARLCLPRKTGDGIDEMADMFLDPSGQARIRPRLEHAVGRRSGLRKRIESLCAELGRMKGEGGE